MCCGLGGAHVQVPAGTEPGASQELKDWSAVVCSLALSGIYTYPALRSFHPGPVLQVYAAQRRDVALKHSPVVQLSAELGLAPSLSQSQ